MNSEKPSYQELELEIATLRQEKATILRDNNKRWKMLFQETANVAVQGYDKNGQTIYWNKASEMFYGYTAQEAIGQNITDLIIPEALKHRVREDIREMFKTKVPIPAGELTLIRKDGSAINVFSSHSYVEVPGSEPEMFCLDVDITEHKQAEEALKESEEKIRYILKHNPNAIAVFNNNMDILLVSDRFKKDYHKEHEELIGRNHYDVFPEIPERWRKIHQRVLKGEILSNEDDSFERPNGSITYSKWECRPWFQANGSIGGMIAYTEVTTERKLAEIALKESEEKLKSILNNMADVLWSVTYPDFQPIIVSESAKDIYGYSAEQFLKDPELWSNIIHPDDQASAEQVFSALEKTGKSTRECRIICPDGKVKYILDRSWLVYENDKPVRVDGIARDITEQKKAEYALKKSEQQLRELNDTKDKLFSIISHDLRSPFNSILGLSDLLALSLEKSDIEEAKNYSNLLNKSGKSALTLVDNLLNWAKSQTRQLKFDPIILNLRPIVLEVFNILKPTANLKDISLQYHENEQVDMFADENMIKTILRNLISNAIKFTHTDGKISVHAEKKPKAIEITVSDNGVGINKDIQDKLFQINKEVTTGGTANEKGSGLGLIICKEFVQKHGGQIWVESEIRRGSAFKFSLPLR